MNLNGKPQILAFTLGTEGDREIVIEQARFLEAGTLKRDEHFRFDLFENGTGRVASVVIKVWKSDDDLLWSARLVA